MHHSEELPEDLRRKFESAGPLGATGRFPEGKISPDDAGEIAVGILADSERRLIHFNFGNKPIAFMSMSPEQALEIAKALIKQARHLVPDLRVNLH